MPITTRLSPGRRAGAAFMASAAFLPACTSSGSGDNTGGTAPTTSTSPQIEADVRLGPPGNDYQDTELLAGENLMSFTDTPHREAWVARIDPATGTFLSEDGHDLLVDTGIATFGETLNGLDFGLDEQGWSVFYTKPAADGTLQVWRATPQPDGELDSEQLTSGLPHHTTLAQKDPDAPTTALGGMQGDVVGGDIVVWDEDTPDDIKVVGPRDLGTQIYFLPDSPEFMTLQPDGNGDRQFHVGQLATGETRQVTTDPGDKRDGGLWFAPELNALAAATVVDNPTVVVYSPTDPGDTTGEWSQVRSLAIPATSQRSLFKSPEPFVLNGRSYLAVGLHDQRQPGGPGEIWVYPIDGGEPTRCDASGENRVIFEPEPLVIGDQAYVYYTELKDGMWEAWRCAPRLDEAG